MDRTPASSIPRPSGIPRPSRLPVLKPKTSTSSLQSVQEPQSRSTPKPRVSTSALQPSPSPSKPGLKPRTSISSLQQSQLRPVSSNERLRKQPSRSSLTKSPFTSSVQISSVAVTRSTPASATRFTPSKDAGVFKKPTGRPASRQARLAQHNYTTSSSESLGSQEDGLGALEGFRSSSRASSRQGFREIEQADPDIESAYYGDNGTLRAKKSRPSLSDRTIESLSQISSSPKPGGRRRKSSFFSTETLMKPESRPASAMSNNPPSRPGTSDGTMRGTTFLRPTTPSEHSDAQAPGYLQRGSVTAAPGKRSVSVAVSGASPTSTRTDLGITATPSKTTKPSPAPTPKVRGTPRTSLVGAHSVGARTPKPRPTLNGLFGKPKSSTAASVPNTPRVLKENLIAQQSPESSRKVSNSSAALREQIAKAKAARKSAVTKQDTSSSIPVDAGFDFDLPADPFNQAPKRSDALLQKRVDCARLDGRLNIAAMGLNEIPEAVMKMYDSSTNNSSSIPWGEVVDIVRFVAADNEIEIIPDEVFPDVGFENIDFDDEDAYRPQFGGIELLDLHGNILRELPMGFRRLQQMTALNLSRNRLTNAAFDVITEIPNLRDLKITENNLEETLPGSIGRLKKLESLELQGNKLCSLPDSIEELARLRILNLTNNQLTTLPMDKMSNMSLVELLVSKNALSGSLFSPSATGLPQLQMLDASCNSLSSFSDDGAIILPELKSLNISSNRIQSLPDMSNWARLVSFLAGDNRLACIPEGFTSLSSLKNADLTGNDIIKIDERIALMERLEAFTIAANPLRERKYLTMAAEDIKRDLRSKLEPAQITDPSGEEVDITAGDEVDATERNSRWALKPSGRLDLSSQMLIDLNDEVFAEFVSSHDVKQLELHHNLLTSIPSVVSLASTLTLLNLSHNSISTALSTPLTLPYLRDFRLSSNKMTSLESLLTYLTAPSLESLDVTNNRLSGALPALRSSFPGLLLLLASDNAFSEISADALRGLKAVNLSNNDIDRVPPEIGLLSGTLMGLELEGNRFRVPSYAVLKKGTEAVLSWLRDKIPADDVGETF